MDAPTLTHHDLLNPRTAARSGRNTPTPFLLAKGRSIASLRPGGSTDYRATTRPLCQHPIPTFNRSEGSCGTGQALKGRHPLDLWRMPIIP
ncbi:hypothetical protein NMY22_g9857 [Coprinellus aureogranulatus]|nr:hypothetical protein NMY22_g9857 [Coprinellus aureogranulatus]